MRSVPGGRHCESCEKTVYDLRLATAHAARGLALVHGRDGFCGRLTVDAAGWFVAAVTALSVAACGNAGPPRVVVVAPPHDVDAAAPLDAGENAEADAAPSCAATEGGTTPNVVVVVQGGVGSIREYVHFASGSSAVPPEAGTLLDAVVDTMRAHPEIKSVVVEGHADLSEPNPQPLSDERAKKVVAALVKRGVDAARLVAKGYAAAHPIADNATAAGRDRNRRVEFRVAEPLP